ncbi:MAG: YegS/Rv2252/BmrU family lipid kinase [Clostridiales bacterium]|nr:YegS/Rv2252/BmrU family lipid kinase [Clostridiales bacterium]
MIKDKILMIYNPTAGNGVFKANLDKVIDIFQREKKLLIPIRANSPEYLDFVFEKTKNMDFSKIIAAGGDGTINIVVNAMIKNGIDLPLAIFPSGTANDFAYYFDIPHDIEGMAQIALKDNYSYVDVGKMNEKYFINVAAMGFIVDVSQKTDPNIKSTLGIISYYLKGMSEVPKLQPIHIKIESEEYSATEKMYFMLVMNGRSAGGFRRVGVNSVINDGLLDVMLVKEMPITELPGLLINFMQGNHTKNKNVVYFKTKKVRLETDHPIGTDIDGEKGSDFPLEIECIPRRLKINTLRNDMEGSNW